MQRILVPLDGSELAEGALPYAVDLATQLSATLYLVRVVSTSRHMAASSLAGATGGMDGMSAVDIQAIQDAVALQTREADRYLGEQAQDAGAQALGQAAARQAQEIANPVDSEARQASGQAVFGIEQIDGQGAEEATLAARAQHPLARARVGRGARYPVGELTRRRHGHVARKPLGFGARSQRRGEAPFRAEEGRDARGVHVNGGFTQKGAVAERRGSHAGRKGKSDIEQRFPRGALEGGGGHANL